ncbi:MAG TPA: polyprenyl diphosphate synthase [Mariprofundaceae bacterium]|nr:polyprenyl diphosphate synthase [Mariprofundaceae bacterium]
MSSPQQPPAHLAIPRHVGIIMDGNGRWAKQRGLPRLEGHRRGADRARDVVSWAADLGIRELSLYAFSTENWERPQDEVSALMSLLATLLPRQLPEMQRQGVRLKVLGDISPLPGMARRAVEKCCAETAGNSRIDLILCLNYGGQQEIVAGVRKFVAWLGEQIDPQAALDGLDPKLFRSMLWRSDMAPVDLLIRTGGEQRISNFHLWDAAYAELYFSDVFWPDYSRDDLAKAVEAYGQRERRFGLTSEQVR